VRKHKILCTYGETLRNKTALKTLAAANELKDIKPKQFASYPGRDIEIEFLRYVAETGAPDTWRFHTVSQPPSGAKFEEVCDFVIAKKFHQAPGKASCPICSPQAPKYFHGFLAWFPDEGCLRAIGRDCAVNHFGVAAMSASRSRKLSRDKRQAAEEYLIATYPRVKSITDKVMGLKSKTRIVDLMQRKLWDAASKAAVNQLYKLGKSGYLSVYQREIVHIEDRFGRSGETVNFREVSRHPVKGFEFLSKKVSVAKLWADTLQALTQIEQKTDDEALNFVANELSSDQFLFEAERLVRNAEQAADQVFEYILDAELFFSRENLQTLVDWSGNRLSESPVIFMLDQNMAEVVKIRSPSKAWTKVPLDQLMKYSNPSSYEKKIAA
jgi:hypothetical protein